MIRRLAVVLLTSAGLLAALLGGCGGDGNGGAGGIATQGGGGEGAGGGGSAGEGGDGGDAGAGGSATVLLTARVADRSDTPVEAAGVAVDLGDGTRIESSTDAQGMAYFELDAGDTVDQLIAHKNGYSFDSWVGSEVGEDGEITFWLFEIPEPPTLVEISGSALNMHAPASDALWIMGSNGAELFASGATSYSLLVESGEPFALLARDLDDPLIVGQDVQSQVYSTVVVNHGAVTQPATVDIDFGAPTAPDSTFSTSWPLPADAALASSGVAQVLALTSNWVIVGGSSACTRNGSGFDCSGEVWDIGEPVAQTHYTIIDPAQLHRNETPMGRFVQGWVDGAPADGPVDLEFPNPPDLITPIGLGPHPIDTPVQFTVASGGASITVAWSSIFAWDHGRAGHLIGFASASETAPLEYEFRVPALPSTSDPASVFVSSMQLQLYTCHAPDGGYCEMIGVEAWEASPPAN